MRSLGEVRLAEILPHSIAGDAGVARAAGALDGELRGVSTDTVEAMVLSRIDELTEAALDLLAWQWHVDIYDPGMGIDAKRAAVRSAILSHRRSGTPWALKRALQDLGYPSTVKEDTGTPHVFDVYASLSEGADAEDVADKARSIAQKAKNVRSWLGFVHLSCGAEGRLSVGSTAVGGLRSEVWPLVMSGTEVSGGAIWGGTAHGHVTVDVGPGI